MSLRKLNLQPQKAKSGEIQFSGSTELDINNRYGKPTIFEEKKTLDDSKSSISSNESLEIVIQRYHCSSPQEIELLEKEASILRYLKAIGIVAYTDPREKETLYYENKSNLRFVGEIICSDNEVSSCFSSSPQFEFTPTIQKSVQTPGIPKNNEIRLIVSNNPFIRRRQQQLSLKSQNGDERQQEL